MDGEQASTARSGPCRECGVMLPVATQRYCVNCGADLAATEDPSWFDSAATVRSPFSGPPSRPGGFRRPTTWSSGDFRAPAPTDGQGLALPPEPEPAPGVEWNGPVRPVVEPPAVTAGEGAEAPGGSEEPFTWQADMSLLEQMLPFAPQHPVSAGPIRLEISHPPDPVSDDTGSMPRAAPSAGSAAASFAGPSAPSFAGAPGHLPGFPPPAPVLGPRGEPMAPVERAPVDGTAPDWPALGWPAAPQRTIDLDPAGPPVRPGPALRPGPSFPPGPGVPPPRRSRSVPLVIAIAGVVLVASTAGTVWWLRSRGSTEQLTAANPVSASGSPGSGTSAAPTASASGASGAAVPADVTPPSPTDLPSAPASDGATGSPTATSSASAQSVAAFAAAVDGLLGESASARAGVSATVASLQACRTDPTRAATTLRSAGRSRTALAERGRAIPAAAVPGGADVVSAFVAMQKASAAADDDFAAWADDIARSGCRNGAPHTAHWAQGNQHSAEATTAKSRFVQLWNPIAAAEGRPRRSTDGI